MDTIEQQKKMHLLSFLFVKSKRTERKKERKKKKKHLQEDVEKCFTNAMEVDLLIIMI